MHYDIFFGHRLLTREAPCVQDDARGLNFQLPNEDTMGNTERQGQQGQGDKPYQPGKTEGDRSAQPGKDKGGASHSPDKTGGAGSAGSQPKHS